MVGLSTRPLTGWGRAIYDLTPVEERNGRWYKREDLFAPMGPHGINGSKLRQLIWLTERAAKRGAAGMVNGASVHSPQLCMSALVGRHFGMPVHIILGGTKPETARKHASVRIAAEAGATFEYIKVGYNPAIQRAVKEYARRHPDWFMLCYGITTSDDATDDEVARFHAVGAEQVRNLSSAVTRLIVPFGSANSATSILYGLALYPPPNLAVVTLVGIGPNRLEWLDARLEKIERATGTSIRALFRRSYWHQPELASHQDRKLPNNLRRWRLEHHDLHDTGYVSYGERRPYNLDGITFHPTYEGKVLHYMQDIRQRAVTNINRGAIDAFEGWWDSDGTAMLWVIGSEPR